MAVKSSGALAIQGDIVAEFGGSQPHSLSEYYGGAGLVPAGANPGVATSGAINMNSFYGTVAATVLTISSNTNNYNIKSSAVAAGGDVGTPVILTINSGVTVGSTSSSNPAMKTDTGWSNGVTINITNNGSIVGAAGSDTTTNPSSGGGNGGGSNTHPNQGGQYPAGSAGQAHSGSAGSSNNGGNAFEHSQTGNDYLSVVFATAGTRTGGAAGQATFKGNGGGGGAEGGGGSDRACHHGGQGGCRVGVGLV